MEQEQFFVRTLEDLHRSINSNDSYEILRSSLLIRQLFLDGNPLVHQVNRAYGEKFTFEILDLTPPQIFGFWFAPGILDPLTAPTAAPRITVNQEKFFGTTIACVEGQELTVYDFVDYLANANPTGGVHAGTVKTPKHEACARLHGTGGGLRTIAATLGFLRGIGRVILRALRPLHSKVLKLERFEDAPGFSIHATAVFFPQPAGKENYFLDIGIHEDRNRISIFLDTHGQLCLRIFDTKGQMHTLIAGGHDCAYRYGELSYLVFQAGTRDNTSFIEVEAGSWTISRTYTGLDTLTLIEPLYYVFGSDMYGKAPVNMAFAEKVIYPRVLGIKAKAQLRGYFDERMHRGYEKTLRAKGNQFMHSVNHPNFMHREELTE